MQEPVRREDSCMSNFKKVLLLAVLLILFEQVLGYALEPVTFQHYLDMELRQKGTENKQPDMVFIGNSRVSTTFIPSVFSDRIEGVSCAFNAGTGSQGIEGTYYYLKDILNQYNLKYVVFGLDYQTFLPEERVPTRDLLVLKRIRSPLIRAAFIGDVFEPSEYIYFLKSYQYRGKIGKVGSNLKKKLSLEYRQGIDTGENTVYEDLGFTRETEVFGSKAGIYLSEPWTEEAMDRDKLAYLDRIVTLCREKGAELYVVSTPLTISTVYATPGYGACTQFFQEYLEERGVAYDNLNLMKERETLLPDAKMNSMEHVGDDGADLVSDFYCEVLCRRMRQESVDGYFYGSVSEMKEAMSDLACVGLHTEAADEEGNREIVGEALCKEGTKLLYQFELVTEKEVRILQEYSEKDRCPLSVEDMVFPMTLRIRCRAAAGDAEERVAEVDIDETSWD